MPASGVQTQASSLAEGGFLGAQLGKGSGAGDYAIVSAAYVNVDAVNLTATVIIPKGFVAIVSSQGLWKGSLAGTLGLSIADGGVTLQEQLFTIAAASNEAAFGLTWMVKGDGASHVFTIQGKTSAGTLTVRNSSVTHLPSLLIELTQSNF